MERNILSSKWLFHEESMFFPPVYISEQSYYLIRSKQYYLSVFSCSSKFNISNKTSKSFIYEEKHNLAASLFMEMQGEIVWWQNFDA